MRVLKIEKSFKSEWVYIGKNKEPILGKILSMLCKKQAVEK